MLALGTGARTHPSRGAAIAFCPWRRTEAATVSSSGPPIRQQGDPSRRHHIGLSKNLRCTKVIVLIDDLDIRVLNRNTGHLIRKLILDPTATTNPAASNAETAPKTPPKCQ